MFNKKCRQNVCRISLFIFFSCSNSCFTAFVPFCRFGFVRANSKSFSVHLSACNNFKFIVAAAAAVSLFCMCACAFFFFFFWRGEGPSGIGFIDRFLELIPVRFVR